MVEVRYFETDTLSTFRTRHRFLRYAAFTTVAEFLSLCRWAKAQKLRLYILGNGSNTLFTSRTVRTLVLRNELEQYVRWLDDYRVEVSSSVPIRVLLKQCYDRHLDSFYYLAAVPATVGGAIAMNAGRGLKHHMTIFDFVESVSYVEGERVISIPANGIERDHRWTPFVGISDKLIVSAVFRFGPGNYEGNPIVDRLAYAKETQDLSAPNCGSIFKECDARIQNRLRGLRIGKARFSPKIANWIVNNGKSPWPVRALICVSVIVHRLLGRRAVLEIVRVR
jgi:UDP-N-acetylmuramate dehydrogenase